MRKRRLTAEDRDIWSRYSRSAEPMHPLRRDPSPTLPAPAPMPEPRIEPQRFEPFSLGQRARPRVTGYALAPAIREQVAEAPLRMDAKAHKRMIRGKLRPEAKLDLHGMTLDTAHPALIGFILSAQGAGKRLVIVVTGKGKARPDEGPIPTRFGILRHQVPQWLRMAPLSGAVLQVTEAHRSHGGGGAYYVYLRR